METPYDYNYTRPKAVVFPAPPPTTNALSPDQRARLVRSSKKIARVLGATPRFVDSEGPARGNDNVYLTHPRSISRASIDSSDSISSCSTTFTSTSHNSSSTSATSISSSGSLSRSRKPLTLTPLQDTWPARKPPTLRLDLATSLESIPASPRTPTAPAPPTKNRSMTTRHRRLPPLDGSASSSLSEAKMIEYDSPQSSPTTPSFVIPSITSTRRRKMDRLRRMLGDGVPIHLVFPDSEESDAESDSEPSLTSGSRTGSEDDLTTPNTSPLSPTNQLFDVDISNTNKEAKSIPRVPRTPPRKKKISNTRDSLALASPDSRSPHVSSIENFAMPRANRPAPPPPAPSPPISPKKKLNGVQRKPIPSGLKAKPSQIYEHPPIVHHRSHSDSSSRSSCGLGVILEEKGESGWYGSDYEDEEEYEFVREDEVLGAVSGWGSGSTFLYRGPVGKGMGRGLARSYGNVYSRA